MELVTEGRRVYAMGAPYALKDALRNAGGKWDTAKKAWWIGTIKRAEFEKVFARAEKAAANPTPPPKRSADDILADEASGKAQYKGRWYLVLWCGKTSRGEAFKLAFTDGTSEFWADAAQVTRHEEFKAPVRVRWYADKMKARRAETTEAAPADDRGTGCRVCARIFAHGGEKALKAHLFDGCDACGREEDW